MNINYISKILNIESKDITYFQQISSIEDNSPYDVWQVTINDQKYILKKAKNHEIEIYNLFLNNLSLGVPNLYSINEYNNETYLLIEYIEGHELFKCNRNDLIKAVDALIYIQNYYWNHDITNTSYTFENSLTNRINRGKYLNDCELEIHYNIFLEIYTKVPKTLCHDDLLPFNVIVNDKRGVIIDWEYAGNLPYLTSFARLIAHGGEDNEFFYINESDKEFIINYYYDNLIMHKNISYKDYLYQLNYFLLYEYCEWIMLKNKYPNADEKRYNLYLAKAKSLILSI